MLLAPDQKLVEAEILSGSEKAVVVRGHAGTGKTALAIHCIKKLLKRGNRVLVTCPTHQAKEQFCMKLGYRLLMLENLEVTTIAAFLGQYPRMLLDGRLLFDKGGFEETNYDYIFVDETSMVSQFEMEQFVKHVNGKVIFLGDFAQLKPVMKKQGDLHINLKNMVLTTQHRNKDTILKLCEALRDKLFYPEDSNNNIHVHSTWEEMSEKFIKTIKAAAIPTNTIFFIHINSLQTQYSSYTPTHYKHKN